MSFIKNLVVGGVFGVSVSAYAHAGTGCDETALHEAMESIKTEMKSMSYEIKSGHFAEADKRVANVIEKLRESRHETPYLFKEEALTGDELSQRMGDYQSVIDGTIEVLEGLDKALQAGDAEQAKSIWREIGKQRKKGHRAFKADC